MATIHQPREKGQMQCTECGKWLMNSRCLKSHMILHSNISYSCTICEYVTKKKILLNRHMMSQVMKIIYLIECELNLFQNVFQHSEEKPFECDLCGKSFKLKRALTIHVAKHGSAKTFQCSFCDRKFNSSTNFYTHRKSAHPRELAAMKNHELELQRKKRIAAGVEEGSNENQQTYSNDEVESTRSYILTTDLGEEITIINVKNERNIGEEISVPISILDESGSIISTKTIVTRYPTDDMQSTSKDSS